MNTIKLKGKIEFDPKNKTKKHNDQGAWKRVAMVLIDGEVSEYYAWFVNKRYNLPLNKPLRGSHVTFINDRTSTMNDKWEEVKAKWDGKEVEVVISVDPRTDSFNEGSSCHWWFNIPEEHRTQLHDIRSELGLDRPRFGLHMSLGYANDKNKEHSKYIHKLILKGFISYDS